MPRRRPRWSSSDLVVVTVGLPCVDPGRGAVTALPARAWAQRSDPDLPPAPARHFDDAVGLVDEDAARRFADDLYSFEQRTGIQFVVAVLPEHSGNLEDYVNRLYEHWRIGQSETHRGVLFVSSRPEKQTRIEVGYGLEEALPDVIASRILKGMLRLPRESGRKRIAYVIRQVASAVAPDDPLAQGPGPWSRTTTRRISCPASSCVPDF